MSTILTYLQINDPPYIELGANLNFRYSIRFHINPKSISEPNSVLKNILESGNGCESGRWEIDIDSLSKKCCLSYHQV
jgi:hypothetical protein